MNKFKRDKFGNEIEIGDYVFSNNFVYEVKKIGMSTIAGMIIPSSRTSSLKTLYPESFVKIERTSDFEKWLSEFKERKDASKALC